MPITVVKSGKNTGTGSQPGNLTIPAVKAGNTLVLQIGCANTDAPAWFDSTGQLWKPRITGVTGGTGSQLVVYTLDDAIAGDHVLSFNGSLITPYNAKLWMEVNGARSGDSFDDGSLVTGSGPNTGVTITSNKLAQPGELIISSATFNLSGVTTDTCVPGYTIVQDEPDSDNWYGSTMAVKLSANTNGVAATWAATGAGAGTTICAVFGLIPVPIPAPKNSSGLRRWLIQYYSDYFAKREKEQELEALSKEMVKQASAGVITEKVRKPITERVIERKPDVEAARRRIQLQLQRNYLNKALAEFTGTQAIISQVSQLANESISLNERLDGEQADEDFILLASIL